MYARTIRTQRQWLREASIERLGVMSAVNAVQVAAMSPIFQMTVESVGVKHKVRIGRQHERGPGCRPYLVHRRDGNQRVLRAEKRALYLNQLGLDTTSTDTFGHVKTVRLRQDIQLQKVNLQFLGWLMSRKFRYLAYVWTSNTSQGLGAQVVVGGNLQYAFNSHVTVGGGIGPLPSTRSLDGTFPYWLPVDNRLMADEFFRASFTTGI